jgi:hypothetical protein
MAGKSGARAILRNSGRRARDEFKAALGVKRLAIWMLSIVPLAAHHSTAAFDMTRSVTVTGVVSKFVWANPHSYIELDANGDHWRLEIEAVNLLRRYGWTKDSLKSGDKISCTGARAKDPAMFTQKCFTVEFPDGRTLTATPSGN